MTISFVDVFFNRQDAYTWIEHHVDDHPKTHWHILEEEVKLLPSGGYRAGIVFQPNQGEFEFA